MLILWQSQWLGLIAIVLTAVSWSFLGLLSKFCLLSGLNPFEISFFRCFFGFIAFLFHCILSKSVKIPCKHAIILLLFGAWGVGAYYSLAQYTILLAGACMDIILQYTAPFWVALFAWCFFKEGLCRKQLVALFIAALGTLFVCLSGGSLPETTNFLGIITGLLTGLCYASHYPFTRIWQKNYSSSTIFCYMLAGGSLALLFVNLGHGSLLSCKPAFSVWLALLTMGLVCTYLAFIFFGVALKRISLVQAAITSEIEPVLSMFLVCLLFDEYFSPIGWIGSLLILISVLILALNKSKAVK
ncbi:MAG: EamA family transporter [Desulfovibrio sp.]|nr:EamA family transporter [Desulfovibrio sp.]